LSDGKNSSWARELEEMTMRIRLVAAATLLASFTVPAFAANQFYIVQDIKTKKCTVLDKKPTESSMTVVSPAGAVYKTTTEAETGM
jgi:hypothetical protein